MKIIIVGMGIQGNKRKKYLGRDFIYSVDKNKDSDFNSIYEVPLQDYDAAFICLPENAPPLCIAQPPQKRLSPLVRLHRLGKTKSTIFN